MPIKCLEIYFRFFVLCVLCRVLFKTVRSNTFKRSNPELSYFGNNNGVEWRIDERNVKTTDILLPHKLPESSGIFYVLLSGSLRGIYTGSDPFTVNFLNLDKLFLTWGKQQHCWPFMFQVVKEIFEFSQVLILEYLEQQLSSHFVQ